MSINKKVSNIRDIWNNDESCLLIKGGMIFTYKDCECYALPEAEVSDLIIKYGVFVEG